VAEPAPEPGPEPDPAAAPPIDLDALHALWPAAVEAVRDENAMVGALLADARPAELEGERLTIAFAEDAAFSKKKAEANRALLITALRGLTGHSLELVYELRDAEAGEGPDATALAISEDELLERLKEDFGATEVLDHEE
jgi:DNA polymerase III subunit gamma/tau